jgi:hypothetical protein
VRLRDWKNVLHGKLSKRGEWIMNRLFQSFAITAMLAFALTSVASAAGAPDPAIGTWKLNLEKSKYPAGAAPKSETRTYAAAAGGTLTTVTGVAADGSATSQSATLTYDGKDDVWTGSASWDAVSLKRVNGTTVKAELKKGGKVVGHSTRTISGKGTVLTLATAIKTAKGGTTHQTAVYDRQK